MDFRIVTIVGVCLAILLLAFGVERKINNYRAVAPEERADGHLYVEISWEDYLTFIGLRDRALQLGYISDSIKKFNARANVNFNGTLYEADLSPVGQTVLHIQDPQQWSFRLKLRNDSTIMGMQEFAVSVPKGRATYYSSSIEQFNQALQRRSDLFSLKTGYLNITLNGFFRGVYFYEEANNALFLESRRRRDGMFFKVFNEGIEPVNMRRVQRSEVLTNQYDYLQTKWRQIILDGTSICELFDCRRLGRHYALAELSYGMESILASNLVFYFNPMTMHAEPIGSEWEPEYSDSISFIFDSEEMSDYQLLVLRDTGFISAYIDGMKWFTSDPIRQFVHDSLCDNWQYAFIDEYLPDLMPVDSFCASVRKNMTRLQKLTATDKRELIASIQQSVVDYIGEHGGHLNNEIEDWDLDMIKLPYVYSARGPVNFTTVDFQDASISLSGDTIHVIEGELMLKDEIFVPEQMTFLVEGGTTFCFSANASLDLRGHVDFRGDSLSRIKVEYNSAVSHARGTFRMTGTDKVRRLKGTDFMDAPPANAPWHFLTGVLTVYRGELIMDDCSFSGIDREDALNVVDAEFDIRNCRFSRTSGDAVDFDFSSGRISGCEFRRLANDAIDISGGFVGIDDVDISNAGDKGVSIGERSHTTIANFSIEKSRTGVACKDASECLVTGGVFVQCDTALAAYVKKPIFGKSEMLVKDIELEDNIVDLFRQGSCNLTELP